MLTQSFDSQSVISSLRIDENNGNFYSDANSTYLIKFINALKKSLIKKIITIG